VTSITSSTPSVAQWFTQDANGSSNISATAVCDAGAKNLVAAGYLQGLLRFPNTALAVDRLQDRGQWLTRSESALMDNMHGTRLTSFSSGRYVAKHVQQCLALTPKPILQNGRLPIWPAGLVGSISHSKTYAAAVATTSLQALGVDIETPGRITEALQPRLFTAKERHRLRGLPDSAATVAFAAKEAGFKAISPIVGEYVSFLEAEIDLEWRNNLFTIRYIGNNKAIEAVHDGVGHWSYVGDEILVIFGF
tara:strand:+ start:174 stop:923 length:750 start_codon:yes stop_codon:yes gene_type:complete